MKDSMNESNSIDGLVTFEDQHKKLFLSLNLKRKRRRKEKKKTKMIDCVFHWICVAKMIFKRLVKLNFYICASWISTYVNKQKVALKKTRVKKIGISFLFSFSFGKIFHFRSLFSLFSYFTMKKPRIKNYLFRNKETTTWMGNERNPISYCLLPSIWLRKRVSCIFGVYFSSFSSSCSSSAIDCVIRVRDQST